jgi:hypothetical protein
VDSPDPRSPGIPPSGTPEHAWWKRGAQDEAAAVSDGISDASQQVIEYARVLARARPEWTSERLAQAIVAVFAPSLLRRRYRTRSSCRWPRRG